MDPEIKVQQEEVSTEQWEQAIAEFDYNSELGCEFDPYATMNS